MDSDIMSLDIAPHPDYDGDIYGYAGAGFEFRYKGGFLIRAAAYGLFYKGEIDEKHMDNSLVGMSEHDTDGDLELSSGRFLFRVRQKMPFQFLSGCCWTVMHRMCPDFRISRSSCS